MREKKNKLDQYVMQTPCSSTNFSLACKTCYWLTLIDLCGSWPGFQDGARAHVWRVVSLWRMLTCYDLWPEALMTCGRWRRRGRTVGSRGRDSRGRGQGDGHQVGLYSGSCLGSSLGHASGDLAAQDASAHPLRFVLWWVTSGKGKENWPSRLIQWNITLTLSYM